MDGDRSERELVNRFDEAGFAVVRAPASGSATKRELPDLLVGRSDVGSFAIEAKASAGAISVDESKVDGLISFSETFGAAPLLACRLKGDTTWYLFDPREMERTSSGNIWMNQEQARRGEVFDSTSKFPCQVF